MARKQTLGMRQPEETADENKQDSILPEITTGRGVCGGRETWEQGEEVRSWGVEKQVLLYLSPDLIFAVSCVFGGGVHLATLEWYSCLCAQGSFPTVLKDHGMLGTEPDFCMQSLCLAQLSALTHTLGFHPGKRNLLEFSGKGASGG